MPQPLFLTSPRGLLSYHHDTSQPQSGVVIGVAPKRRASSTGRPMGNHGALGLYTHLMRRFAASEAAACVRCSTVSLPDLYHLVPDWPVHQFGYRHLAERQRPTTNSPLARGDTISVHERNEDAQFKGI